MAINIMAEISITLIFLLILGNAVLWALFWAFRKDRN